MQTPLTAATPLPPRFTPEQACEFARRRFGINAEAALLASYIDQNFHLRERSSGREFVLKIANIAESRPVLEAQNLAMRHLQSKTKIVCPQPCAARDGQFILRIAAPDGGQHFVRLLTFVPGHFLADHQPQTAALRGALGRFLADMDRALADFDHPALHREFRWDIKNALLLRHLTGEIDTPAQRRLPDYFFQQFEACVLPRFPELRRGTIHNDSNGHNLLLRPDAAAATIYGIIDFGDLIHSLTICELAVGIAYAILDQPDPLAVAAQIAAGYNAEQPLTRPELEVLFYLICTRLSLSVSISALEKKHKPDNAYLTISEAPAWDMLERLISINPVRAERLFCEACGVPWRPAGHSVARLQQRRKERLGKSLSLAYRQPLKIVRGAMQYLFDADGRSYIDCVNNVAHVGHCHPHVVAALHRQAARLNTNTRYLHESILELGDRLCATLPEALRVCFFVNSGSEANELALRLARSYTGSSALLVVDGAYHGNTSALVDISPYKFDGPGGSGAPPHVHKLQTPDGYRGAFGYADGDAGEKYARQAEQIIARCRPQPPSFICESIMSCAGQIPLPPGYLAQVYQAVRARGGVCIADEVQVGFGRAGSHFWAFELQGVVPDIVTMGKPMGNGHPLGAVVTTPEIAAAFANGMEYFNTYGGNPVSCAVGLAVLEVIEKEQRQRHARAVGETMLAGLRRLAQRHTLIGDVRGTGLFLGIEFVADRETKAPAAVQAAEIVEKMKARGFLLSTDGPLHNVIKIKPPMCFTHENASTLIIALDAVLQEMS